MIAASTARHSVVDSVNDNDDRDTGSISVPTFYSRPPSLLLGETELSLPTCSPGEMSGVTAIDHALPNGNGANANNADPGGMTNDEKQAVGGLVNRDESKGAAVHVCPLVRVSDCTAYV